MTGATLDLEIDITAAALELDIAGAGEDLGPPPAGAPVGFREQLARALKTTDPDVLRDAEAAYVGVYESEHAYIAGQVAEHLQPPDMTWVLECCEPDKLRHGYEGLALVVWSIALDHPARLRQVSGPDTRLNLTRKTRSAQKNGVPSPPPVEATVRVWRCAGPPRSSRTAPRRLHGTQWGVHASRGAAGPISGLAYL